VVEDGVEHGRVAVFLEGAVQAVRLGCGDERAQRPVQRPTGLEGAVEGGVDERLGDLGAAAHVGAVVSVGAVQQQVDGLLPDRLLDLLVGHALLLLGDVVAGCAGAARRDVVSGQGIEAALWA
jgi:hypothetical protein